MFLNQIQMTNYDIERLDKIRRFYADNGIMPTYKQMEKLLDRTRNAIFKFIKKMILLNKIKKIGSRIAPGEFFFKNT